MGDLVLVRTASVAVPMTRPMQMCAAKNATRRTPKYLSLAQLVTEPLRTTTVTGDLLRMTAVMIVAVIAVSALLGRLGSKTVT